MTFVNKSEKNYFGKVNAKKQINNKKCEICVVLITKKIYI